MNIEFDAVYIRLISNLFFRNIEIKNITTLCKLNRPNAHNINAINKITGFFLVFITCTRGSNILDKPLIPPKTTKATEINRAISSIRLLLNSYLLS